MITWMKLKPSRPALGLLRPVPAVLFLLLLAVGLAACAAAGGTGSSPSPRPAVSASALPGLSGEDRKQDRAAYEATGIRVVEVFIKDGTPRAKKEAMAGRIAAMPEVEAYHFVSKREALARFSERFSEQITANCRSIPFRPHSRSWSVSAATLPPSPSASTTTPSSTTTPAPRTA